MDSNALSGELLTLGEIAAYLKVAEKTILRMIQKGDIPCVKIASQWRFDRGIIDQWILGKMNNPGQDELTKLISEDADQVPLSRLTGTDFIITDLVPGEMDEVLSRLAEPLLNARLTDNLENFVTKLLIREEMMSTSIGHGIAMPHIRNPRENTSGRPAVIIGICPDGTPYNTPDGEKIRLFFLVYTNSEIAHLRIIAKLNSFLRREGIIDSFLSAKTEDDVLKVLLKE